MQVLGAIEGKQKKFTKKSDLKLSKFNIKISNIQEAQQTEKILTKIDIYTSR